MVQTRKVPPPKRSSNKRPLLIVGGTLLAVALLVVVLEYTHVTNFWHKKTADTTVSGPTPEQQKQQSEVFSEQKKQAIENPSTTPSTPPPVESSNVTLTAQKASNGTVTVFTKLNDVASGTCTLTVTNGSNTNSQTAQIIYQPEYSTCAGFSVPISSVGTGTWTLSLSVTSNGVTASKTITQEIQ